ncbi:MAG TPA: class I SAM-dependent methyltransferase [Ktedonobacteraceae bacterium]|nr:class I SAM-dependent methyltransferase [Ktedonobacteraceae bacterium]
MSDIPNTPDITNQQAIAAWSTAPRELAENFGDEGDFARQHLLNPALFALLGDVAGKHILDAGCGQGYLCRLLARRGAIVTGVEPAVQWYSYAVEREHQQPLGITYLQEDLSSLQNMQDRFDCVIANMVFMDIPDYKAAMHNCIAALKSGGSFIFSLLHPCFEEPASEWVKKGYVEVKEYLQEYTAPQTYAYFFHRPLSAYINFLIEEGCTLRKMLEPRLSEEIARQDALAERSLHVPQFVVIHAVHL